MHTLYLYFNAATHFIPLVSLYPLKTLKEPWFSVVSQGDRKKPGAWNEFMRNQKNNLSPWKIQMKLPDFLTHPNIWLKYGNSPNSWITRSYVRSYIWDKVFKNGPSKFCVIQPLKNFLKAVFHKSYLVHS